MPLWTDGRHRSPARPLPAQSHLTSTLTLQAPASSPSDSDGGQERALTGEGS